MRKSLEASFITVDMLFLMLLFGLDLAGCGWRGLGNGAGTHCGLCYFKGWLLVFRCMKSRDYSQESD